jgi:hypothetical protein
MMRIVTCALLVLSVAALADPMAEMQGAWNGSGWARETPDGPQETVRCRLKNTYDADVLTIKGRCAVPGRKLTLSGEIKSDAGSEEITGHWFNPDGLGSVRIKGVQRGDILAFTFRAKDPETGRDIAQDVEWRVSSDGLRLRATDRSNPDAMMSDISFKR